VITLRHAKLTLSPPRLRSRVKFSACVKSLTPRKEISTGVQRKSSIRQGPGKHWLYKPAVIIRRDGKEVCNVAIPEGYAEYHWRVMLMWIRQEGVCCNCRLPLALKAATFEHQNGRGAAKRDDRIALYDEEGRFVCHINGASCAQCNRNRGSRRTDIYHGNNAIIEVIRRSAER
jgi:hypothetical protein